MADWAAEASNYSGGTALVPSSSQHNAGSDSFDKSDDPKNRTELVQGRLKIIYKKCVLPVEKRFQYDYFYESPCLSDVEFDCKYDYV